MKKTKPKLTDPPSEEFQRFQEFARKLIAVPKKEIEQQKAKYDKKKQKRQVA